MCVGRIFIKILFWIVFFGLFSCESFPPRNGVFTEITKVKGSATALSPKDGFYPYVYINNNTISQTISQARDYVNNHGGIIIGGNFTVYIAPYCCFNEARTGSYLKIFKRDNIPVNNNITYGKLAPSQILQRVDDMDFTFNVTFDDPTISVPESHIYTIEFWECLGECKPTEYDKKTDKKGEITINYSVTP